MNQSSGPAHRMRTTPLSALVQGFSGRLVPSTPATACPKAGSSALPRRFTMDRPSRHPATRLLVAVAAAATGGRAALRWTASSILTLRLRVKENRVGDGGGDGA